ncbi:MULTISPECIES: hypothetical protein [unclassified Nostoc]|uniref:hypothetical protein n=1 Tax=unclassified Nostoc TaxID=2593658 RepID=UPI00260CBD60|nr:hypothetical protein [Nostoc sp. S13]MDF5740103.1 hypothetical protein [Nostoc sp. S13]
MDSETLAISLFHDLTRKVRYIVRAQQCCAPTEWSIYVKIAVRIIVGWVERSHNLTLYFEKSKTLNFVGWNGA